MFTVRYAGMSFEVADDVAYALRLWAPLASSTTGDEAWYPVPAWVDGIDQLVYMNLAGPVEIAMYARPQDDRESPRGSFEAAAELTNWVNRAR